jgi:dinuclear metal center YbgI/SA1388 family protein
LTHHPLILEPLTHLDIHTYPGNVIAEAIKRKVSVITLHTNLDAAKGGINDILADLLELRQVEVLKEMDGMEGVGLGRIGNLSNTRRLSDVAKQIKRILDTENLKIVGEGDCPIKRIAVVGGSGGSLASLACEKEADLLLTGDVSYHHALEAQSQGIALIDGGHFHTEKTAFRIFGDRFKEGVAAEGWEVEVEMDEDQADPMHQG